MLCGWPSYLQDLSSSTYHGSYLTSFSLTYNAVSTFKLIGVEWNNFAKPPIQLRDTDAAQTTTLNALSTRPIPMCSSISYIFRNALLVDVSIPL